MRRSISNRIERMTFGLTWWNSRFWSKAGRISAQSIVSDQETQDKNKIIKENQVLKKGKCKARPILDKRGSRICVVSNLQQTQSETQAHFIVFDENRWERDHPWPGEGICFRPGHKNRGMNSITAFLLLPRMLCSSAISHIIPVTPFATTNHDI